MALFTIVAKPNVTVLTLPLKTSNNVIKTSNSSIKTSQVNYRTDQV